MNNEEENEDSKVYVKKCLVDYSENSTIHGIKYVFTGKRNLFAR
jgi:hypothetical protein